MSHRNTDGTLSILLISSVFLAFPAWAGDVEVQLGAGDGFVIKDSTATERWRVDESGNLTRSGSLFLHEGNNSLFLGPLAGSANSGSSNSAFGAGALDANTTANNNSSFGYNSLGMNSTGAQNSAFGTLALGSNTTGNNNSAFGYGSLGVNSTGTANAAFGYNTLDANTTASNNSAFGYSSLSWNATGTRNSAFGAYALALNTTANSNSAFGYVSLNANSTGTRNSAFGTFALDSNTTANNNSAFGYSSLGANATGTQNSAFGGQALLANTTESMNSAFGFNALSSLSSGNTNVALGWAAGGVLTTGSNNIYIGNVGAGTESGQLRIGSHGVQTDAFVAGISGNVVAGSPVLVNGSSELGVAASSLRFKHAVRDMGDFSGMLMSLRPVTFRYREEYIGPDDTTHFGLIAEEVAKVAPGLVHSDDEGRPFSVRYEFLAPLLLNEVQKQQRTIEAQKARIGVQAAAIESQTAQLAQQQELIAAVTARVEQLEARPQLAWVEPIR